MPVSANSAAIFNPAAQNRALVLCVLASVAIHALALLLPGLRPGAPAPAATRVLTAILAPRDPAGSPQREASEAPPRPVPPKAAARPLPEAQHPVLSSTAPAVAAPRAAEAAAAPVPAAEAAAIPAASAPGPAAPRPAETQPAAVSPGAGAARAGSDADSGTRDQYRLALIVTARRYKRYPAQAMDRGWQGKVEIRLVIGASGTIQSSLITTSSGYEVLDNQALDMVKKAKPLTPIPAALRGREFTVDIPVIFDLQAG